MLESFTNRITGIFSKITKNNIISENDIKNLLKEIRYALLDADVHYLVVKQFIENIKEKAIGSKLFGSLNAEQSFIKIVKDEIITLLGNETVPIHWSPSPPTVILMCGLQGSGKTTTTAKLAKWFTKQQKKVVLAACDIQRPAAIQQLKVLGDSVHATVFSKEDGTSPLNIARQALEYTKHMMQDILIIDTSGRLSIDDEMMNELKVISEQLKPQETFLVIDASTGQEALNVASSFHKVVPSSGVIFTKLDGDTRGGAILSIKTQTGIPVRFIGIGEDVSALDQFDPERMAGRILGMGDMLGLIQKAEENFTSEDTEAAQKMLQNKTMDFNMMLTQIQFIKKMGSIKNIMKYIPGMNRMIDPKALDNVNTDHFLQMEAIIQSMTKEERSNPALIKASRKKRIATGSGRSVEDVNLLIKQVDQMKQAMKQFGGFEKKLKMFGKK